MSYATIREAAIAGLKDAMEQTKATGYEFGGFVIEDSTGYKPTKVATSNQPGAVGLMDMAAEAFGETPENDRKEAITRFMREHNVVSAFHTHTKRSEDTCSFTSMADASHVVAFDWPEYMACESTMGVYEVTPKVVLSNHPLAVLLLGLQAPQIATLSS